MLKLGKVSADTRGAKIGCPGEPDGSLLMIF